PCSRFSSTEIAVRTSECSTEESSATVRHEASTTVTGDSPSVTTNPAFYSLSCHPIQPGHPQWCSSLTRGPLSPHRGRRLRGCITTGGARHLRDGGSRSGQRMSTEIPDSRSGGGIPQRARRDP